MRIGIDARFVGPAGTGLGKYTEKLIQNLVKIDSQNQYFIFLRKENWDYLKLGKNFKKILADVSWYSLIEQVTLPKIFRSQNLDLLHVPHFNVPIFYNPPGFNLLGLHERSEFKGEFIVTIHDLIHHQFAETSTTARNLLIFKAKRLAYRQVIAHAIKKSAKIIVPSKNIKEEVISTFRIDPSKVVVTYEAAEEEYFDNQKLETRNPKLLNEYHIKTPFMIYVGNAYPHKNLEKLLEAFKILTINHKPETRNLKLTLVCSRDVFWQRLAKQVQDQKLNGRVIMTSYIPARELSVLFRQAKAYVFPSLSEGFGIPGLNAMAAKIPVVCSDILTLKEIYGDAALYFDPNDPEDIASKINQVVSDSKIRSRLIDSGLQQVRKYSWQRMAKETLRVYESVFV
ncbi:MAG: glycosyl transferase, group 1 [Candidatus Curtissbacteria bacterium GW2011_GWC2_38_9]|uniref:Glycosyl transferase, group 1 n=1 Tax=Candidatus Curtissbacteria bacterium GW2011_GWC2_38_9 TaxID=1618414 RepID=A0A0G0NWC2_9BACT|nr:MAG: glycosyl transferase, group 1 [Candidatus Curtissbacteria bacterium GW2011_GWC2_38_9]